MVPQEIGKDSSAQDVMVFAMKMEEASHSLYRTMQGNYEGTELESVFARLAQEELRHKETLEREYEDHFMQWM
jgi:rubrerythrin